MKRNGEDKASSRLVLSFTEKGFSEFPIFLANHLNLLHFPYTMLKQNTMKKLKAIN
jgi:hypothetical protein